VREPRGRGLLVAVNSVFQIVAYSLLGWFYLELLPGWLGLGDAETLGVSVWDITRRCCSSSASRSQRAT
jgi:ACR3 family arsenite efflux pump ArsB